MQKSSLLTAPFRWLKRRPIRRSPRGVRYYHPCLEMLEDRLVLSPLGPTQFVVTNTLDSGTGSLRQAILDANAHANALNAGGVADKITFDIPGTGVQNIVVATQLPDIAEAVNIDGYTQSGAARSDGTTPATIEIQLSRIGGPSGIDGLVLTSAGSTIAGLMITNFSSGIRIDGAAATDNVIAGNWIGTADGVNAAGNFRGILVVAGAANNTIGGADGADRNVISGNTFRGVQFASAGDSNTIVGNFIGTDATGTASLGNGGSGIEVGGTANSFIGSNLVSSNSEYGILLSLSSSGDSSSDGNVVQGNLIGTDITGANPLGNLLDGILIQNASGNQIGGITPDARNIISGNVGNGISIFAALGEGVFFGGNDNVILGNYIGTDATGLNPLGNLGSGILVAGGARNQIGGTTDEERNVIAGNRGRASIDIIDSHATANTVQGNFIGTDATGNTVLLGGESTCGVGIENGAHDNLIGGSASGAANIIFSPSSGVDLSGALANTIESNFIGVGADAATPLLGNVGSGVLLDSGSSSNIVRGNEIAYGGNGLMITDGSGNFIQDNLIHDNVVNGIVLNEVDGNLISGNDIHANSVNGIVLFGSTHTFIANNLIHDNAGTGILVDQFRFTFSQVALGNTFSQNSIYANSLLGIDLGGNGFGTGNGVTPNDVGDADTGYNNLQNDPVITDVEHVGDTFFIHASLNSTRNTPFRIEFFANSSVDSSGFGEGEIYLGSANVSTDGDGNAATTLSYFGALPFSNLSVTATNLATGDTSEFGGFGSSGSTIDPLVVTTTDDTVADDGLTSLREAILYANMHAGPDTITFAIPGDGVHTINVASALPNLTDAVTIDGWSQPGFTTTPIIELSGANAGFADGLHITASNVTIRGLVINQFGGVGIALAGPAAFDSIIQGNYIGTDATGTLALPNLSSGIDIRDGTAHNLIGTDGDGTNDASEGNVISGNRGPGIFIDHVDTDDNVIAGNIIGLDASGTSAIANSTWGIGINQGARTIVGGDLESERNIISGNSQGGVFVVGAEAIGTVIQGNYIGTDITGSVGVGNTFSGVISGTATGFTLDGSPGISGSASNTVIRDNVISANQNFGVWLRGAGATGAMVVGNRIGTNADGTAPLGNRLDGVRLSDNTANNQIEGNHISGNLRNGILADGAATIGNRIQGNAIFNNVALGIDIGNDGVTANDPSDADSGTNGLQNYPTITEVSQVGSDTVINVSLNSTPNTAFRIEFFASTVADPSGFGEGELYLGFVNVTTDAFGNAMVAFTNLGALPFSNLSATASNVSTGDTSEFGPNLFNPLVVTTTSDAIAADGYVSLREAITYANAHAGVDTISFNIPGSGVQTIRPLTALPAITDTIAIDGYTQPGATPNTNSLALGAGALGTNAVLKIEIDASQSSDSPLLSIGTLFSAGANNSTIRGLVINGSHGDGIDVFASGTVLEGNFIGTDATGTIARPNQGDGVNIEMGAANVRIGGATSAARNLISGNLGQGIETHSSGHTIQGNFIGVNAAGTGDLGNANAGIDINPDAGGGSSGGVITIPQSALIPSTQYYTEQIGIGLGSPLLMTGGGSDANVGASRNDDGFSGPIDLGFTLHFFGHDYTQFYANNNGNISFSDGISSYTPDGPQGADEPIISPFFADVDTRTPGSGVMYLNTQIPNEVIITWDQVGYYGEHDDKLDCFQLVLRGPGYNVPTGEGVIAFYWKTMQWETGDASGGSEGFGGTPAAVGFGDGDSSGNVLEGSIANGIAAIVQNHKLWFQSDLQPVAGAAANIHVLGNLIAGNDGNGIRTDGLQNSLIQGNFIGTNLTGTAAIANGSGGINYSAGGSVNSLTIGGPNAADRNLISGNTGDGITFTTATGTGHALTIQNNNIGLQADGVSPLGNTGNGVSDGGIWSGTATIRGNRIAFNTRAGAAIGGTNIQVAQNAIYANGGLGIDRAAPGVTTDPNLPYPVITSLVDAGATLNLGGTLQGKSNTSYTLEFYANATRDPSGFGEGQTYLGSQIVTTNASGFAAFTATVANVVPAQVFVSGTATESSVNNTFEFGPIYNAVPTISPIPNQSGIIGNVFGPLNFMVGDRETPAGGLAVIAFSSNLALLPNGNLVLGGAGANRTLTVIPAPGQSGVATVTVQVADGNGGINTDVFLVTVAGTFVVTNTNDSGAGSLRQAILNANAHANTTNPGGIPDNITFAIPGVGVQTINVTSQLPTITDAVTIDGYTQADSVAATASTPATIEVRVNRGTTSTINGLTVTTSGSTIRGLMITGFVGGSGIVLSGPSASNNIIAGAFIGTTGTSIAGTENGNGVLVTGGAHDNTIGGVTVADRNIISGNNTSFGGIYGQAGVAVRGAASANNAIIGNYIGTNATGTADLGNGEGVFIEGANTTLGGLTATSGTGPGNVISGNGISFTWLGNVHVLGVGASGTRILGNLIGTNAAGTASIDPTITQYGVYLESTQNITIGGSASQARNVLSGMTSTFGLAVVLNNNSGGSVSSNAILGNFIGTDITGTNPLGNVYGVYISNGGTNNRIGGFAPGEGNLIANNTHGVVIAGAANGNQILGNSIYANRVLGIDLGDNGMTANDTGDGDTGPNGMQNYPIITSVAGATVTGTLNSTANRTFRIELFTNTTADVGAGPAQGRQFLGIVNVTTNASGNASFTFVASSSLTGLVVTATATDLATNETSEFSTPNYAPVIDINGPANLDTIGFNDFDSQGTLVNDLIARTDYSDLNAADPRGIAVTGLGNPSDGVWQYALDGTTWQNMGAVSDAAALLLDGRAGSLTRVRFIPTNGFAGQANFTFRAWDQSDGRANGNIADTTLASSSLVNFDDVVLSGVPTTISGERYASQGIHFNTVISSGVVNVGNTLTMNNYDNRLQVYGGPGQYPVSPPNFATAYLADSSRDVLMTFDRAVTSVSLHHDHYPFDAPNVIRLIGLRATGVPNQYVVMAYDQKFDNATEDPGDFLAVSFGGLTFDAVLFEIVDEVEGFDDVTFAFSGPSSFSADTETARLTVEIAPLNVAPQLFTDGAPYLNPVVQGATNDGTSLNELAERTSYADPDGPQFGIAITGVSTLPADGVWEYQLNFDSGWLPLGDVSPQSSRLLLNTNSAAAIRFVPSADFTGQATLSYRLWDGSDGNVSGALVTGYSTGGSSAFSSAIEDAPLTVVPSGPFVVDSAADVFDGDFSPGHLSLREAVYLANLVAGPNTISFDPSLTDQTIHLNSQLDIHEDVSIVGLGADHLTIDADSESRIFDIGPASDAGNFHADVSISGITLTHGFTFAGGAIYADSADLILDDVHLQSNQASIGGALYLNGGSLTVVGSVFSANHASNLDGDSAGGAIYNQFGSMHITDSTFDHNQSDEDGGAVFNRGELYVTNSTFSANDADDRGGAIYNRGDLFLVNVTLTGNRAAEGGAIYTATSLDNDGADSRTKLDNTIVAGNYYRNTSDSSDLSGAFVDPASSHDLIGDPESAAGLNDGDNANIVGDGDGEVLPIDQILDTSLRDNGGPTQTHALSEHSLAINAGDDDAATANGLIDDQRGIGFDRIALGAVDIGAFESGSGNQAPTSLHLSPRNFDENLPPHTLVGRLSSTDPNEGDTAVYDLVPGFGDNALFSVSCNKLYFNGSANYEVLSHYSILVRVTDSGGLSLEHCFTIRVNNVNEAPDSLSLSNDTIDENVPANTVIGLLSSTDPDDVSATPRQGDGSSDMVGNTRTTVQLPVYSIVQNVGDFAKFTIFHGALRILESPDFEAKSSYQIVIRVTDAGGLSYEQAFTIHIRDVNETPLTLTLANADALGHLAVNENVPVGTPLGNLFGADPDAGDTLHFTLIPGYGDNGKVAIQGNALKLSVSPDYETQRVYEIQIAVIDRAGLRLVRKFALDIRDLNEAPTGLSLVGAGGATGNGALGRSIGSLVLADTTRPGTVIATLDGLDPDAGDVVSLRLIDTAGGQFVLAGNQLIVAPGAALSQDTATQFTLTFQGIDRGNLVTVWSIDVVLTRSNVISFESALFDQGLINNGKPAVRLPVLARSAVGVEPPADTNDAEDASAAAALDFVFVSTADLGSAESVANENRQALFDFALGDTRPVFGELPWPSRVLERMTPNGNDASWASEGGLATNQSLAVPLSGVSNLLESGDGVRYFSEALRNHAQAQVDVYVEPIPQDPAPPVASVDSPAPDEESLAWTATLKKALCWIAVPIAAGALVMCGWLALRKKRPEPAHEKPVTK